MRNQIKRTVLAVATAIMVGGGVLGIAPAASASTPVPCPATDPYRLFGANQWGAGWGANGVLQSWNVSGTRPVTISCVYHGENWQFTTGVGNQYLGTTAWTNIIRLG